MEDEWLLLDRSPLMSVFPLETSSSSLPFPRTQQTGHAARTTSDHLEKSPSDISLGNIAESDNILVKFDSSSIAAVVCAEIPTISHSQASEDGMGPRLSATGATPRPQSKTRLAGCDSSHQRNKSGSSCTSVPYRPRSDCASAAKAPKPDSASPNSTSVNGTEAWPPPPSAEASSAAPGHRAMVSFPLLKTGAMSTAAHAQKQQPSHVVARLPADMTNAERYYVDTQLDRLWGHRSCGESLERPIRAQLSQTRLVSPLGRRVTELVAEHLASYQERYHELCPGSTPVAPCDLDLDSDSALYHRYTALAATSSWHASLGRAEAVLAADLLDFQMLHLERYLFLYGSYMFTDDGDVTLPGLHRDFWWEAAERKRRWERAFCAIPGNQQPPPPTSRSHPYSSSRHTTSPAPMPDKLRDLYQLILEEESCSSSRSSPYLPLWQYVAWDATRPGGPACPADVGAADDDATTAAHQYSRRRALEDLRLLGHRLPPAYAALAPHLRVAIGAFLEANYHGFYEDCVSDEYANIVVVVVVNGGGGGDGGSSSSSSSSSRRRRCHGGNNKASNGVVADSVCFSARENGSSSSTSSGTNARTSPTDTTTTCGGGGGGVDAANDSEGLSTAATAVN